VSRARRPATSGPAQVEKRAAFESPARLAEREAVPSRPTRVRRPAAVTFGTALVVLRGIVGIVWLIALAAQWDEVVERELDVVLEGRPEAAAADAGLALVLVAGSALLVIDLVLAVLVWFGSNGARIAVMLIATANITVAAIDSFTGEAEVTIRTTFLTVALDILILLALSSRESRAFARLTRGFALPRRIPGA
jgi:hypothetical protein